MSEENSTPTTHCPKCKKIASSCGGGGEATNEGYASCLGCDVTWGADATTREEIVRQWSNGALAGDGRLALRASGFAQGSEVWAGVNKEWLVDILEKFRERCLESVNLISDGFYGEVAENDIRAIDVKAWLASASNVRVQRDAEIDRPLDDWIEREIARLFPDGIDITPARLRVRVAVLIGRVSSARDNETVGILQRFRDWCVEEVGALGCDRDHSANDPADRVRQIDAQAWLASTRKGG